MRGVVSLATALALPFTIADGSAFPHRDMIIFLSASVIIFTLVVQGSVLPWLIKRLALSYNPTLLYEDWNARVTAAREALNVLEKLSEADGPHRAALERICGHYSDRLESLGDGPNTPLVPSEIADGQLHPLVEAEHNVWQRVIDAERQAVIRLRKAFEISDDVMHDILRELDLLSTRFSASSPQH